MQRVRAPAARIGLDVQRATHQGWNFNARSDSYAKSLRYRVFLSPRRQVKSRYRSVAHTPKTLNSAKSRYVSIRRDKALQRDQ